ncbi:MAG: HAD family hydrolase [Bacillota bacterium]|nr:HAD family hydrolase [Bacillota bacterium]
MAGEIVAPDPALPLRGVIFDLGGTLMHGDGYWEDFLAPGLEALEEYAAERLGGAAARSLAAAFERNWRAVLERYDHDQPEVPAEEVLRRAAAEAGLLEEGWARESGFDPVRALDLFLAPELSSWRALPGAVELLRALRAMGLRVGLISNASRHRFVLQEVERFGFAPYLDPVVTSAGFGRRKPSPAIFRHVLDRWRLEPGEVAMVGDLLQADVEGARRTGMRSIWLTLVPNSWNDPYVGRIEPEATAGSYPEVLAILRRWWKASGEGEEAASGSAS